MNKIMKNDVIKLTDKERVTLKNILDKIDSSKVFQDKVKEATKVVNKSSLGIILNV